MRIYLAPIRGITDCIYRNTFGRYFQGVDAAVAPFISSVQGRKIKAAYLRDILPENNRDMPLIPQVLSNDPDDFLFLAQQIFALGWQEINWNLGCPAPMVANKHRGSGLLANPERICQVLDKVLQFYPGQISLKVRLGRDSPTELERLLPILDQYPLSEIIIHPRLGVQMYKGVPDLEAFRRCLPLTRHNLVYNGDIIDVPSFASRQKSFAGIHHWMIGRGLLANPFLADKIKNGEICLKIGNVPDILKKFHNELLDQYKIRLCGDSHVMGRMKGLWGYLADFFANPAKIRKKINKIRRITDYQNAVDNIFTRKNYK
ncbi:MAG: tRNA-dihydrouridine synthase family protein [Deltaproteobacteria bacterium]|nr:tRNA-dihydrouridine synthase family protein [Deltaproteobacteria bacterium]